jgi:hypothetical protein
MSLSHNEGFLLSISHDGELHCLFPESSLLTVVSHNLGHCRGGTLIPEDLLGLLEVVKIIEVDSHNILPRLSIFIGFLGLFIRCLCLFGLSIFYQNFRSFDFLHQRSSLFKVPLLEIKSNCFLIHLSFFIKSSCFRELLDILADNSNIDK